MIISCPKCDGKKGRKKDCGCWEDCCMCRGTGEIDIVEVRLCKEVDNDYGSLRSQDRVFKAKDYKKARQLYKELSTDCDSRVHYWLKYITKSSVMAREEFIAHYLNDKFDEWVSNFKNGESNFEYILDYAEGAWDATH